MIYKVIYSYQYKGFGEIPTGEYVYIFEAKDDQDARNKVMVENIIPRPLGEKLTIWAITTLDYSLPQDFIPLPFDEIEAAL